MLGLTSSLIEPMFETRTNIQASRAAEAEVA
jgi:hypothetical protein